METKEIEVNGKKFTIKEIKYKDVVSLNENDKSEASKKLIMLSTDMSDEDYENLSMKEGIALQKVINEINGLDSSDFQMPATQSN